MKVNPIIVALSGLLVCSTAIATGEVAVFPISGEDLTPEEEEQIGALFARAYAEVSQGQVLAPQEISAIAGAAGDLLTAARALAVFEYIDVVAARRAGQLEIQAALFDSEGRLVHRAEMTALSIDDFAAQVGRLAAALFHRRSFAETPGRMIPAPSTATPAPQLRVKIAPPRPSGGEVAVFPVKGTNLGGGAEDAIGVLFAQAYTQVSGQPVLMPDETASVRQMAGTARDAARILAVAQYVAIRAVGLATKIQVTATLYGNDGEQLHWVQMTIHNLDDFQSVATPMANALFQRLPVVQTHTVERVATAEDVKAKGILSNWIIGFKLEGNANLALGIAIDPTVTALLCARIEAESYFIEVAAGAMIPTSTWRDPELNIRRYGGVVGELGINWYLMDGNTAAYAGGGIMPRLLGGNGLDPAVRIAVYAQGGVMFFRQSSWRLYSDLRVAQNVLPFQYFNWNTNVAHEYYPTEIALSVGIGF